SYWQSNTARADRHLGKLPPTWMARKADPAATRKLFALLREGKADPACDLAVRQLLRGVGAQALWDAVHLATAALVVRHKSGWCEYHLEIMYDGISSGLSDRYLLHQHGSHSRTRCQAYVCVHGANQSSEEKRRVNGDPVKRVVILGANRGSAVFQEVFG